LWSERFFYEVASADFHGIHCGGHDGEICHYDDICPTAFCFQPLHALDAVHTRHLQIEQDDAVGLSPNLVDGFLAVTGGVRLVTLCRQNAQAQVAQGRVIIDDKNRRVIK
jgi:hypothetical protein